MKRNVSGRHFQLPAAFTSLNAYEAFPFRALGQYWLVWVFSCDGWYFTFMLFVTRELTLSGLQKIQIPQEKPNNSMLHYTRNNIYRISGMLHRIVKKKETFVNDSWHVIKSQFGIVSSSLTRYHELIFSAGYVSSCSEVICVFLQ